MPKEVARQDEERKDKKDVIFKKNRRIMQGRE